MTLNNVDDAYVGFTKAAAEAIRKCGVKRVVSVSALGRGWNKCAGLATANIKADDLLASTGVALRALAMPSFMDNLLRQAQSIKEKGVFSSPIHADLKAPTVAVSDIAAVAARFLMDTTWTGQAEVPVLGPEEISPNEMAEILSDVLGKPVRFQQMPMEAYKMPAPGKIVLDPGTTKNRLPRGMGMIGEMRETLLMQKSIRDAKFPQCPYVFFNEKGAGSGIFARHGRQPPSALAWP